MSQMNHFYAVVVPGLEAVAVDELRALSAHEVEATHGGVHFRASNQTMYRINLRSRIITRILMRLSSGAVISEHGLTALLQRIDWRTWIKPDMGLDIRISCHHSRLHHVDRIRELLLLHVSETNKHVSDDAVVQRIDVRLDNNHCQISLDTSGERLDRRGYRLESGKAPLRETLAAALLQWAKWTPKQPLLNPMCGSGTLAIEAALLARHQLSDPEHPFSFQNWASFQPKRFNKVLARSLEMQRPLNNIIIASDLNKQVLLTAERNAQRAKVEDVIQWQHLNIRELTAVDGQQDGLIVCNPPYGRRIGDPSKLHALWRDIGSMYRQSFAPAGWRMVLICPSRAFEASLRCNVSQRLKVFHGGQHVEFILLNPGSNLGKKE